MMAIDFISSNVTFLISGAEVQIQVVNSWLLNYDPKEDRSSDNGEYFTSKYDQDVYSIIFIISNFMTTYHFQRNGQV